MVVEDDKFRIRVQADSAIDIAGAGNLVRTIQAEREVFKEETGFAFKQLSTAVIRKHIVTQVVTPHAQNGCRQHDINDKWSTGAKEQIYQATVLCCSIMWARTKKWVELAVATVD
eukprot:3248180-Amphidinium_carterae.1